MTSSTTRTVRSTLRSTVAVAALVLGVQVAAACGTDTVDQDSGSGNRPITPAKVQGVGSADAIERRANPAPARQGLGSADAVERRTAAVACHISADAAERGGEAPCGD
jgi:hypothetical protein